MKRPKVIILIGPTAVGKTKLSIDIGEMLNSEIISADSMQIYKLMDIGTAKIKKSEMKSIKHHMIDIAYPNEPFSVAEFQKEATDIINLLHKNKKIPIVVGGSGLYINSLIYDLNFSQTKSDLSIREYYYNFYKENGSEKLYNILKAKDPLASKNIHKNNIKRIIRALEVYDITGIKFSEFNSDFRKKSKKYDFILIGLKMERKSLYNRINLRVDQMVEEGLIDEVKKLIKLGYSKKLTSMQGLGYKEIISYLYGNTTLNEAIRILKRDTRRFAKRQFTWFKKDDRIKWFDMSDITKYDFILSDIKDYILLKLEEVKNDGY